MLLGKLKNITVWFEKPRPLGELPSILDKAIEKYASRKPRLYKVHKDFFETVMSSAKEIEDKFKEIWKKYPRGSAKSLYICWKNKLSRWTHICVRIRSEKLERKLGIGAVTIDTFYRPWSWAVYYIELVSPSKRELEEKLEKILLEEELEEILS